MRRRFVRRSFFTLLTLVMFTLLSFAMVNPSNKKRTQCSPVVGSSSATSTTSKNIRSCVYHPPPVGVTYDDNYTVFGDILRGEKPSKTLEESKTLLAFEDIRPRAPLHALVIPKAFVPSVYDLKPSSVEDIQLVKDLQQMGTNLIQKQYPNAYEENDYILCFHIPPFNSVNHLHLHVLAPASKMPPIFRYIKYSVGTRWCTSVTQVIERLEDGKLAVPYWNPFSFLSRGNKKL